MKTVAADKASCKGYILNITYCCRFIWVSLVSGALGITEHKQRWYLLDKSYFARGSVINVGGGERVLEVIY